MSSDHKADACHGKSLTSEVQPAPPKKCSEVVIVPFDDGWPEYEDTFIDGRHDNRPPRDTGAKFWRMPVFDEEGLGYLDPMPGC